MVNRSVGTYIKCIVDILYEDMHLYIHTYIHTYGLNNSGCGIDVHRVANSKLAERNCPCAIRTIVIHAVHPS